MRAVSGKLSQYIANDWGEEQRFIWCLDKALPVTELEEREDVVSCQDISSKRAPIQRHSASSRLVTSCEPNNIKPFPWAS